MAGSISAYFLQIPYSAQSSGSFCLKATPICNRREALRWAAAGDIQALTSVEKLEGDAYTNRGVSC